MSETGASHTRRANSPWPRVAVLVVAVLAAGIIGGLLASQVQSSNPSACSATAVASKDLPSVAEISVRSASSSSTGSGEVIRSDGYILTNNHVISSAANGGGSIEVLFSDGMSAPATITGRDPETDLAVIKVAVDKSLPVIPFASSTEVVVGEPVVALGAPLGLTNTVTSGIVSALDRTVEVPSDHGTTALLVSAIQTDAAINPGNSGGTLADCSGDLIGVPSAGAVVPNGSGGGSAGSVGLNFAIPSNLAQTVSNEIIETGTVTHSFFGISVTLIPSSAAAQAGTAEGFYVNSVVAGGPSAKAGLQQGDIITSVDGQPATDPNQLEAITLSKRPGESVPVTYERDGKSYSTTVVLGARP